MEGRVVEREMRTVAEAAEAAALLFYTLRLLSLVRHLPLVE